MDVKVPVYPFPTKDTPVSDRRKFNREYDGEACRSYFFTIGLEHMRPSPCSFLDISSTMVGKSYRVLLVTIFHLLEMMFYGEQPNMAEIPGVGGHRVRVFMEYLLARDTDPADFTLIDCVGIRFRIDIYDDDLDFLVGLLKMIEAVSGEEGVLLKDSSSGDEDGGGRGGKKKQKRKKADNPSNFMKKQPLPPSHDYKKIKSPFEWLRHCNTVRDIGDASVFTSGCDVNLSPKEEHPFHPDYMFSWENSLLPGMKEEQTVLSNAFAFPDAVYFINTYLTFPFSILGLTLPRTPMWFKQDDMGVWNTIQSLNRKEEMERYFMMVDSALNKRNDLKDIKEVQRLRRDKLVSRVPEEDLKSELRKFRERSVKYLATAWNPTAYVSDPIKTMSKAMDELGTWHCGIATIVDKELSAFGNFIVDTMLGFENYLRISTTHATLLRVLVNSLDAYRYEFNLHNNVLLCGAGATGKSHIMEVLENILFLKGTVTRVSHMTDKAMTGDTDANDAVMMFHEMPDILRGAKGRPGDGETGSGIIKDMMTSCKVDTMTIIVDEGRRREVKVQAEHVSTIIMATNEPRDSIPEALGTRMTMIQVNADTRPKFTINDMTSSIAGVSGGKYNNESDKSVLFKKKWQVRQILVNMVNKMIYTGCLEDVDIQVFETVQLKMTSYMREHDIMQRVGNDREIKMLKRFARTLTILFAVDKFISDPMSPGYDPDGTIKFGTEEAFEKLLAIQPYLFCTEEIALFVMSINADQLIDMHHFRAMEVIMGCVKETLVTVNGQDDEQHGRFYTKPVYPDEGAIYRSLQNAQNDASFRTKMSQENIKVAFRELRKRVYNGIAVVEFDRQTQTIRINAAFIKKHFEWDNDLKRYVCNFDLNDIMMDVFYKSYANTFTREQKKALIGVTYDVDTPFLFDTIHKKPNPDHILTRHLAKSNNMDGISFYESTDDYERVNDTIKFKINFEDFSYRNYLSECGYDVDEGYTVEDTLYNHHVTPDTSTDYPNGYIEFFVRFTGIRPHRYVLRQQQEEEEANLN